MRALRSTPAENAFPFVPYVICPQCPARHVAGQMTPDASANARAATLAKAAGPLTPDRDDHPVIIRRRRSRTLCPAKRWSRRHSQTTLGLRRLRQQRLRRSSMCGTRSRSTWRGVTGGGRANAYFQVTAEGFRTSQDTARHRRGGAPVQAEMPGQPRLPSLSKGPRGLQASPRLSTGIFSKPFNRVLLM